MTELLPLLSETALNATIAIRDGRPTTTATFVAQVEALVRKLPDQPYVINIAENRYHFLLGWVAACLRNQVTLLPPDQTAATLHQLRREYPRHHVFDDVIGEHLTDATAAPAAEMPAWNLPTDRVTSIVFTSGTTGRPQPHAKTWASLFHNSRLAARDVLGGMARNVVATVPAQHMYGLEASLLGALTAGCCIVDRKPFFPADVRAALAVLPEPRTLITTPAHLRVLAAADLDVPCVHRVVSATAPLAVDLAQLIEQRWSTEVFEIYGCTEAGVMAHRRTTRSPRWRTLAGGTMMTSGAAAEYRAPQLAGAVTLPDVIDPHGETEFTLSGRAGDMIKVAGKRSSLQELTRQVLSVPGVQDAAVFVPDGEERPAALVVAPALASAQVLEGLRQVMDPVFVPRPMVLVDELPRNELGKLPRESLLRLLRPTNETAEIRIPADHPALAGHFPGNPVVPGALVLDAAWAHISARRPGTLSSLPSVKFLAPIRADETIYLRVEFSERAARFTGLRDGAAVLEGSLVFAEAKPT
jgi:acyl-coenzyme A synthetase/AMP-(fatty) acid ligase